MLSAECLKTLARSEAIIESLRGSVPSTLPLRGIVEAPGQSHSLIPLPVLLSPICVNVLQVFKSPPHVKPES